MRGRPDSARGFRPDLVTGARSCATKGTTMKDIPLNRREQTAFDTIVAQLAVNDRRFAARAPHHSPRPRPRAAVRHPAVAGLRPTVVHVRRVNYEGVEVTRRTLAIPRGLIAVLLAGVVLLAVLAEPHEPDANPASTAAATDRTEHSLTADIADQRQSEATR
jgi:hypothetical protein